MNPFGRRSVFLVGLLSPALGACDESGIAPPQESWTVAAIAGDAQVGLPGSDLPLALEVEVRDGETGERAPGVVVDFTVAGTGARIDPADALTDAAGRARARLRLGLVSEAVRVRATVRGSPATTEFTAWSVAPPELVSSPSSGRAGTPIVLEGRGLAPPGGVRVSFSGLPGRVVSAAEDRLEVEVPACLPSRDVELRVSGPTGDTPLSTLSVEASGSASVLAAGEVLDIALPGAARCTRLALGPNEEVVLVVRSSSTVAGGLVPYRLAAVGVRPTSIQETPQRRALPSASGLGVRGGGRATTRKLLAPPVPLGLEDVAARLASGAAAAVPTTASAPGSAAVPAVGEVRDFQVLQANGAFSTVRAEARYVGQRAAFYVEASLPEPAVGAPMLAELGALFDGPIWEVDTGLYGDVPDLDGNGRVVVLVTRSVNRFQAQGGDGRVGGFFFGGDLLAGQANSNGGEILYVIAPDPGGGDGEPITAAEVAAGLPGVLAHEFQHLIHFNRRMLEGAAPDLEATWLSEALATMAEDRLASRLRDDGDLTRAERVARGNRERAAEFLSAPWSVSLLIQIGTGTLAERGAGWLLLRYLTDRFGPELLSALTRGPERGADNVVRVTGTSWDTLLADWGVALVADGASAVPSELRFTELSLPGDVGRGPAVWAELEPDRDGWPGELRPAALAHLVLRGDRVGEVALGLSDPEAGLSGAVAGLGLRAVRIR